MLTLAPHVVDHGGEGASAHGQRPMPVLPPNRVRAGTLELADALPDGHSQWVRDHSMEVALHAADLMNGHTKLPRLVVEHRLDEAWHVPH